jgi:hypothetical protein
VNAICYLQSSKSLIRFAGLTSLTILLFLVKMASFVQAHMYVDSREKVTARYKVIGFSVFFSLVF